jgi:hypothetical protein
VTRLSGALPTVGMKIASSSSDGENAVNQGGTIAQSFPIDTEVTNVEGNKITLSNVSTRSGTNTTIKFKPTISASNYNASTFLFKNVKSLSTWPNQSATTDMLNTMLEYKALNSSSGKRAKKNPDGTPYSITDTSGNIISYETVDFTDDGTEATFNLIMNNTKTLIQDPNAGNSATTSPTNADGYVVPSPPDTFQWGADSVTGVPTTPFNIRDTPYDTNNEVTLIGVNTFNTSSQNQLSLVAAQSEQIAAGSGNRVLQQDLNSITNMRQQVDEFYLLGDSNSFSNATEAKAACELLGASLADFSTFSTEVTSLSSSVNSNLDSFRAALQSLVDEATTSNNTANSQMSGYKSEYDTRKSEYDTIVQEYYTAISKDYSNGGKVKPDDAKAAATAAIGAVISRLDAAAARLKETVDKINTTSTSSSVTFNSGVSSTQAYQKRPQWHEYGWFANGTRAFPTQQASLERPLGGGRWNTSASSAVQKVAPGGLVTANSGSTAGAMCRGKKPSMIAISRGFVNKGAIINSKGRYLRLWAPPGQPFNLTCTLTIAYNTNVVPVSSSVPTTLTVSGSTKSCLYPDNDGKKVKTFYWEHDLGAQVFINTVTTNSTDTSYKVEFNTSLRASPYYSPYSYTGTDVSQFIWNDKSAFNPPCPTGLSDMVCINPDTGFQDLMCLPLVPDASTSLPTGTRDAITYAVNAFSPELDRDNGKRLYAYGTCGRIILNAPNKNLQFRHAKCPMDCDPGASWNSTKKICEYNMMDCNAWISIGLLSLKYTDYFPAVNTSTTSLDINQFDGAKYRTDVNKIVVEANKMYTDFRAGAALQDVLTALNNYIVAPLTAIATGAYNVTRGFVMITQATFGGGNGVTAGQGVEAIVGGLGMAAGMGNYEDVMVGIGGDTGGGGGGGGGACFPADTLVTIQDDTIKTIKISSLKLGDRVLTGFPGKTHFSPVYFFGHRATETYEYINIVTETTHLCISEEHYLHVFRKGILSVRAGKVRIGDEIWAKGVLEPVTKIYTSKESGMYNPYTLDGNIIVNNVLASCHSEYGLVPVESTLRRFLSEEEIDMFAPIILQELFAPLRALYEANGPEWAQKYALKMGEQNGYRDLSLTKLVTTAIST